ncbi:hypothetical protein [Urechidicola croceus]|uniref:Lipoprotein n=1 Tax=Urechidicola croceus TaxID=1850246 RepID=A0A1D8P469_9FLAO|nr:hypothetical protein [Urechidicola croceus]AOW19375.1 hypothetical protein LPB138_01160 [Urechidicola croceus]
MKLKFIFIAFLFTACIQKKEPIPNIQSDTITVYDEETYMKLLAKNNDLKIKVIDTNCINDRKRAKSDIEKGKLYYFHSNSWYEWTEMAKLISEFNIELISYEFGCIAPPEGFESNCYEKLMNTEIHNRIGMKKIDSLWKIAERNFVLKYPDSLYMKDGIDVRTKYLLK